MYINYLKKDNLDENNLKDEDNTSIQLIDKLSKKDNLDENNLKDEDNTPIQLIDQLKGYYFINPFLALSLAVTLFSFVGVPPLIGFFAKQMVLSAALDNGYIFMVLIAILTSVVNAVYYLAIIKQIFFDQAGYKLNPELKNLNLNAFILIITIGYTLHTHYYNRLYIAYTLLQ